MCGNKNREAFPSEQYCGLKIYEKFNLYEICNKYNENTFAIYIIFLTFPLHTMIYLLQQSSTHVFPMVQSTL